MTPSILALLGTVTGLALPQMEQLPNGDLVHFDGTYYDFRAKDGKSMLKLWVPPEAKPVKGVIVSGHGGGSGDSRNFARDENMKALAARYGFGLVGLHTFPGRQAYATGSKTLVSAFDAFSQMGRHKELQHVPFAFFGSSNGGSSSYGFANALPERTLCFVSNVSSWFVPEEPPQAAVEVPALFVMGRYDPFCDNEEGVRLVEGLVQRSRARGSRWGIVVEDKGHEDGVAFDLFTLLLDRSIKLRYPTNADPAEGPVKLKSVPENAGWLADHSTWDPGPTYIQTFTGFDGDRTKASWLIDEAMANAYQAASSRDKSLGLGVAEVDRPYNPNTDPFTMFSIGGPVVAPGRKIRLVADVRETPGWTKIVFYNGDRVLGEVEAPNEPMLDVEVSGTDAVWSLSAAAAFPEGPIRLSNPFYIAVKDPSINLVSEAERTPKPAYREQVTTMGSTEKGQWEGDRTGGVSLLVSYGLQPTQEESLIRSDGVSDLWSKMPNGIEMNQRTHAREGNAFSIVHSSDAVLRVKSAYSARGLYLWFEVTDNRFMDPETSASRYHDVDAIDVLLDSRSPEEVNDPVNATLAIAADWGLSLTTKQYQVAVGADGPPPLLKRLVPDPFDLDFSRTEETSEIQRTTGIRIKQSKTGRMTRAQEWFLPWSEVGVAGEPKSSRIFAFAPSYKDQDPGEGTSKQLVWIGNTSPWAHALSRPATHSRGWGSLVIGPVLPPID